MCCINFNGFCYSSFEGYDYSCQECIGVYVQCEYIVRDDDKTSAFDTAIQQVGRAGKEMIFTFAAENDKQGGQYVNIEGFMHSR